LRIGTKGLMNMGNGEKEGCSSGCGWGKCNKDGSFSDRIGKYGRGLAEESIKEFSKKKEECYVSQEDIDGFLDACEKSGSSVIDVVELTARKNGIDLSGDDRGAEGAEKSYIRKLLLSVLVKWALDVAQYVIGHDSSVSSGWKPIIFDYIKDRLGVDLSKWSRGSGDSCGDVGSARAVPDGIRNEGPGSRRSRFLGLNPMTVSPLGPLSDESGCVFTVMVCVSVGE